MRGHREELRLEPAELLELLDVALRLAVEAGDLVARPRQLVHPLAQRGGRLVDAPLEVGVQLADRPVRPLELGDAQPERLRELPLLDAARDGRAQLLDVGRLEEVVVGALAQRLDRRLERGVPGQQHGHGVRPTLLDLLEDGDAVEVVEPQVGEDQVELALGEQLERVGALRDRRDAVAVHLEDGLHRHADALVVVDEQDRRRARDDRRRDDRLDHGGAASLPCWHRPAAPRSAARW